MEVATKDPELQKMFTEEAAQIKKELLAKDVVLKQEVENGESTKVNSTEVVIKIIK